MHTSLSLSIHIYIYIYTFVYIHTYLCIYIYIYMAGAGLSVGHLLVAVPPGATHNDKTYCSNNNHNDMNDVNNPHLIFIHIHKLFKIHYMLSSVDTVNIYWW